MTQKPNTSMATQAEREISFVPFGSQQSIKLSITIIKHYVCIPTKSGKLCSDRDAVRFMMLCRSRGLNPFEGDCFLQGYDGKNGPEFSLITAHQAFLKRSELHPEFDGMESGVIVKDADGKVVDREGDFTLEDDTLIGAWATVHFKTRKFPLKERLRLSTFNKGYGRWEIDAAGMIVKCAQSSALRTAFPTQLGGMYLRDEIDVKNEAPTLTGTGDIDLPAVTVESGTPATTPEAVKEPPQKETGSVQGDLQSVIEDAGYSFRDFVAWADDTGNVQDATSLPDFSAVPTKDAKRLLLSKAGLLKGIAMMKPDLKEDLV